MSTLSLRRRPVRRGRQALMFLDMRLQFPSRYTRAGVPREVRLIHVGGLGELRMPEQEQSGPPTGAFWSSLPGILTGVAAVIGSVAAVVALFAGGGDSGAGDGQGARATVPQVVGKSEEVAKGLIRGRGLDVSKVTRLCADEKRGTVLRQKPSAEREVNPGTAVSLAVSSGDAPGQITFPKDNAILPGHYEVTGDLCRISKGSHVWLATRTDGLYPQHELSEGHFSQTATWDNPDDARGGFSHVLVLVGRPGQQAIDRWITNAERTGKFSALFAIPGVRVLDTAQGLRLRGGS
jgi:hypothetical protein